MKLHLNMTFLEKSKNFYSKVDPTPVSNPQLIIINEALATHLGIDLKSENNHSLAQYFSGNKKIENAIYFASVYAGHQFGYLNPQLGDGRAIMIGELTGEDRVNYDLQLKGSGITPYSRNGDGRSPLGPVIREYLVSEAMHHLNISATRSLAAIATGDFVYREKKLAGGILTRVAKSHIRIGTLQYFFIRKDFQNLQELIDYSIDRMAPELNFSTQKYLDYYISIAKKQLHLVAQWMSVGFIHGVMNTDNTALSCETIDFGPCAFMDYFNRMKVYSFIDKEGRYSYGNQKNIIRWNLCRLAECFLPFISSDENEAFNILDEVIEQFEGWFEISWLQLFSKKFGFANCLLENKDLFQDFLQSLELNKLDFTNSFVWLSDYLENPDTAWPVQEKSFNNVVDKWMSAVMKQSISKIEIIELMRSVNPVIIPRNHIVEEAIEHAYQGDFKMFFELNKLLQNPFNKGSIDSKYISPPRPGEEIQNTFCGT